MMDRDLQPTSRSVVFLAFEREVDHVVSTPIVRQLYGVDSSESPANVIRTNRSYKARDFFAALKKHKSRPKLHPEIATKPPPARIGDLDMTDAGMIRERLVDKRLGLTAIAAPRTTKFQQHGAEERIDLRTRRLFRGICAGRGHVPAVRCLTR